MIDSAFMSVGQLQAFLEKEIVDAKSKDILFSLHLKATMMKVSDPIMFGHCVKVYFREVFKKHGATFAKLGVNANNGLGDVYAKIASLPAAERDACKGRRHWDCDCISCQCNKNLFCGEHAVERSFCELCTAFCSVSPTNAPGVRRGAHAS